MGTKALVSLCEDIEDQSGQDEVRPARMKAPKTDGVTLNGSQRPVDYGHCQAILIDKYGKERGEKAYENLFVNSAHNGGWTVCTNIVKEKIAMLKALGKEVPEAEMELDSIPYFHLWKEWVEKGQVMDKAS